MDEKEKTRNTSSSLLYEPLKFYKNQAIHSLEENVDAFFDDLIKRSKVDPNENAKTVAEYNDNALIHDGLQKERDKYGVYRALLIFATFLGAFAIIIGGVMYQDLTILLSMVIPGIIVMVASIILNITKIKESIEGLDSQLYDQSRVLDKLLAKANSEVFPLESLLTEFDVYNIIEKTVPELKFNHYFSREEELKLINEYDFNPSVPDNCSIINYLSGSLLDNPFLFYRYKVQDWTTQMYTGYKTIYWEEEYTDEKGNVYYETRSQTLSATVTKPIPTYYTRTEFVYGHQAAQNLHFSRLCDSENSYMSDKQIERKIKRGEKKLARKARDATENGGNFQEMTNSEFDVLFNATNRDNEVEFRTLFTPLAQINMVDVLREGIYRDDFSFYKNARCNKLISHHSQSFDMNVYHTQFYSYDLQQIKANIKYKVKDFFNNVYGELLPIMSIPAYLEEPTKSFEKMEEYDTNYADFEYETLANSFASNCGSNLLVHQNTASDAIFKTKFVEKDGKRDYINIIANTFQALEMCDYVDVAGGDGYIHSVPVPWTLYDPVQNTKLVSVFPKEIENEQDRTKQGLYLHGLRTNLL